MIERLHFLFMYVGSAATVAFLAACLTSPQIDTFVCHPSGANGSERCDLVATLAAIAPETGGINPEVLMPDTPSQEPVTVAAAR